MAKTNRTNPAYLWGVNVQSAIVAGLLGGLLFLLLVLILMPLIGISPWAPIRMIAAMVLGSGVLPPPATFSIGTFIAAAIIHFSLSIIYAFILAAIVRKRDIGSAVIIGLLFGLVLYLLNFFVATAIFPWFSEARNFVSVIAHLAFGGSVAWLYARAELAVPRRRRTAKLRQKPA